MNEPDLDEYCQKIVAVLTLMSHERRFNMLHRFLNDHGTKISKPTLSAHLKHLTEREIVLRKQVGIQEVIYEMNYKRFRNLGAASEITRDIVSKFYQQEKEFRSLPIGKKIDYLHSLSVLQSLMILRLEVLAISKPKDQFEHSLSQYNLIMHFGTIRNWLLDELRNNPCELEQATGELSDLADHYIKMLFPSESATQDRLS